MRKMRIGNVLCCLVVFLSCVLPTSAQDPVRVKSFPMKPTSAYPTLEMFEKSSLYFLEKPTGDNIAYPFLLKQGKDYGVVDYLTKRIFWLDDLLEIRKVASLGPLGVPQGDGFFVRRENNAAILYKDNYIEERTLLVPLPNETQSVWGGVWYQSDTLFFWDAAGNLHIVEKPIDIGPSGERANPSSLIKNSDYAKVILTGKRDGKYEGLIWDDRYGVMRNGLPLAQIYNVEWQRFFDDQRKSKKENPELAYKAVPASWLNKILLIDTDIDGNQYWGGTSEVNVTRGGYIIASIRLPPDFFDGLIVLPNGSLVLSSWSKKKQVFDIYQIKRTW